MIVSITSLCVGIIVGYLGQRSRMCTIGGLRDYVLVRDTDLLKGVLALLVGSWIAFGALRPLAASDAGQGLIAAGTTPSGLAACAAIVVGALFMLSTLDAGSPYWFAGLAMYIMGMGLGFTMQVLITVV